MKGVFSLGVFYFILAVLAPKCVLEIARIQRHTAKGIRDV